MKILIREEKEVINIEAGQINKTNLGFSSRTRKVNLIKIVMF